MDRPELYETAESHEPVRAGPSSAPQAVEAGSDSQIWVRRGAVVLAALLVAAIAFFVIKGLGGGSSSSGKPQAVDASKLSDLAGGAGHPVYWAGPRSSDVYEWTELSDGRAYIRYLTPGVQAGDPRPRFLTIGTYPVGNGPRAIRKADRYPGNRTIKIAGGGTALVNSNSRSIYLAYPASPYQIEIFDPDQSTALRLVTTGKIQPVP
jgi:hypothetical protein